MDSHRFCQSSPWISTKKERQDCFYFLFSPPSALILRVRGFPLKSLPSACFRVASSGLRDTTPANIPPSFLPHPLLHTDKYEGCRKKAKDTLKTIKKKRLQALRCVTTELATGSFRKLLRSAFLHRRNSSVFHGRWNLQKADTLCVSAEDGRGYLCHQIWLCSH